MPELPEVETIKNDLACRLKDLTIRKVRVITRASLRNSADKFSRFLVGRRFSQFNRLGKLLYFKVSPSSDFSWQYLIIHLKLTGQLIYCSKKEIVAGGHAEAKQKEMQTPFDKRQLCAVSAHTRVVFYFQDGSTLLFNDLRRFGFMQLAASQELGEIKKSYGLDALSPQLNWHKFREFAQGRRIAVKSFLMDQKLFSGIGNIYADEILFAAGVLPQRRLDGLTKNELKAIFSHIKPILKKAIKYRGTTFSDYRDSSGRPGNFTRFLRVYGRQGQACYKCGALIKKIKLGGRGTHFCPICQK